MIPAKPQLTSAPIWLELREVPFQFFNEEGLEHIASLVGHPKCLHPDTASKANLEVAKVFTFIDPRKGLPEAVNVMFDSGEIKRVRVSSPWMPPICSHCKEIGHNLKRCKTAPITCTGCNSTSHSVDRCPRIKGNGARQPLRPMKKVAASKVVEVSSPKESIIKQSPLSDPSSVIMDKTHVALKISAPLSNQSVLVIGESSKPAASAKGKKKENPVKGHESTKVSEAESDSSDIYSSEENEDDFVSKEEHEYLKVVSKRNRRNFRAPGPKPL